MTNLLSLSRAAMLTFCAAILAACSSISGGDLPSAPQSTNEAVDSSPDYLIGPLDKLEIFVWRAPELSTM